jgi:hypothetical protein
MNIFRTNESPYEAALDIVNSRFHHNKMITESAQMLGTAVRIHAGSEGIIDHPKKGMILYDYVLPGEQATKFDVPLVAYANHPCTRWVTESLDNWCWLHEYGSILIDAWLQNHSKPHGSAKYFEFMPNYLHYLPDAIATPAPLAAKDWTPIDGFTLEQNYHAYMSATKQHLLWCINQIDETLLRDDCKIACQY